MAIICSKCSRSYDFSPKWEKKNSKKVFVCRACKIKQTMGDNDFRKRASELSKHVLSDPKVKIILSQLAILSNLKRSEKIRASLKKYYSDKHNKDTIREIVKERWQNPDYRKKVSDGIKQKWEDPDYRGTILGSRAKMNSKDRNVIKKLKDKSLKYKEGFVIGPYRFDFLIENRFLYDKQLKEDRKILIEHYFKEYKYTDNLDDIIS